MPTGTISPTDDFFKNIDLSKRKEEIIKEILKKINFIPADKLIWESRYWYKGVGAFAINGVFIDKQGKKHKAVLKIQGAKPQVSEPEVIKKFEEQNKSKIIKVPRVLFFIPWDERLAVEVYVFENIEAEVIVKHGEASTQKQLEEFFSVYREYRENSLNRPFLPKPKKASWMEKFEKWRLIRAGHPQKNLISDKEDKRLNEIAEFIDRVFSSSALEFQHNHLSSYDIKKKGGNYYLFSNFFWGWNFPLYDSIFAFEWYILSLARLSPKIIKNQIEDWLAIIKKTLKETPSIQRRYPKDWEKFHWLGVVERLVAALNLDVLCINEKENIIKMKSLLWPVLEGYFEKIKNLQM